MCACVQDGEVAVSVWITGGWAGMVGFVHPSERLFHLACQHCARGRQKAIGSSPNSNAIRQTVRKSASAPTISANPGDDRVHYANWKQDSPRTSSGFSGVVIFSGRNAIRRAAGCFDVINDPTACTLLRDGASVIPRPALAVHVIKDVVHLNTSSTLLSETNVSSYDCSWLTVRSHIAGRCSRSN